MVEPIPPVDVPQTWSDWLAGQTGNLLCALLFAPIIAGPVLAWWFNNSDWLWLCAFLIFFMS